MSGPLDTVSADAWFWFIEECTTNPEYRERLRRGESFLFPGQVPLPDPSQPPSAPIPAPMPHVVLTPGEFAVKLLDLFRTSAHMYKLLREKSDLQQESGKLASETIRILEERCAVMQQTIDMFMKGEDRA